MKYQTVKKAREVCRNVGSIVLWRPHGSVPDPKHPDQEAAQIVDEGVDIPYVKPAFV